MASVVHIDNEDSESSIVEIEPPKKPAPLVIDLADEEIIINVKSDVSETKCSPTISWVGQYDARLHGGDDASNDGIIRLNVGGDKENLDEENEDVIDEESEEDNEDEDNDEIIDDENGENDEENEDDDVEDDEENEDDDGEDDEENEDEDEENDEENKDKNGKNDEVVKDKNGENGGVIKDKNEQNGKGIKDKNEEKGEGNKDNEPNGKVIKDKNEENGKVTKDGNEKNGGLTKDGKKANGEVTKDNNDKAVQNVIMQNDKKERKTANNEKDDEGNEDINKKNNQEKGNKATETGNVKKDKNKNDKQSEGKKDQSKQDNRSRPDDHSQPGPSNADPQAVYFQDPYLQATFFRPSYFRPSYYHNPCTHLAPYQPVNSESGPQHPQHWTPEMIKFYDEDWGNEREFVLEKLQEGMDKDPSLWEISSRDVAYWKNKDKKPKMRCYNCFDYGHESYDCTEEERVPKCHMCGQSGHIAYNCPDSICLNCGTPTTGYVTKCKNCKFGLDKVCERCNLTGHIYSECTDHWRLYHSTTGTKRVNEPRCDIYKSIRNRWCCNCGRPGHLQVECDFCVKNTEFSDTLPFVTSYIKAFTRGNQLAYGYEEPEGPKRLKINAEDNIMTNPSQKHVFQRKTSQLKNKLKCLAKEMRRDRDRSSDTMRHPEGGYNRFSFF